MRLSDVGSGRWHTRIVVEVLSHKRDVIIPVFMEWFPITTTDSKIMEGEGRGRGGGKGERGRDRQRDGRRKGNR